MEIRITSLEERHYDTKPIWERALAEITELRTEVQNLQTNMHSHLQSSIEGLRTDIRSEFQVGIEGLGTDIRSEFQAGIEGLRTEMKAEFVSVRHQIEHELRGVARKIDVLNQTFLQIQADQRYVDQRLEFLETQTKGT